MSDFDNLKNAMNQSTLKIFRRLYFKRREGASYESEWQKIDSERVINWGTISQTIEKVNPRQVSNSKVTLLLDNRDGYFNAPEEAVSSGFFYNIVTRYKTLVKLELGFIDDSGNEVPNNPTVFIGTIGENSISDLNGNIKIVIDSLDDMLKLHTAEYVYSQPGAASEVLGHKFLNRVRGLTDGAGHYIFNTIITNGCWFIQPDPVTKNLTSTMFEGESIWEHTKKYAESNNFKTFIDYQGNFIYSKWNLDRYYSNKDVFSAPSDCVFYNQLESSSTYTLPSFTGPDLYWHDETNTSKNFVNMKFGYGAYHPTTGSYLIADFSTSVLSGDKFTAEFWCRFFNSDVNNGVASVPAEFIKIGIPTAASSDNYIKLLFKPTLTLEHQNTNNKLPATHGLTLTVQTSTVTFSAGSLVFFGVVKDITGIENTKDVLRLYFCKDGDSPELVGSLSLSDTGVEGIGAYYHTYTSDLQLQIIGSTNTAMDNLKIYNYAKYNFDDNNTEIVFGKKEIPSLIGISEEKSNYKTNIKKLKLINAENKIYNKIKIKFESEETTTSYYTKEESLTLGSGSSSDKFGIRELEINNDLMMTTSAQKLAEELFDEYSEPKKEIQVTTKIYPFYNLLDIVEVTYQTPYVILSEPFTDGFSDGFGNSGRAINFKEKDFKIIKAQHNLDKLESNLTLREV